MLEIRKRVEQVDKMRQSWFRDVCSKRRDKYSVKYLIIDRQTPTLYRKVMTMRENDYLHEKCSVKNKYVSVKDLKTKPINTLMHDINKLFSKNIHDHLVLQKIVDFYFKDTSKFYLKVGIINLIFNFFPFLFQIYEYGKDKNENMVEICNSICIVVSVFTIFLEFLVLR